MFSDACGDDTMNRHWSRNVNWLPPKGALRVLQAVLYVVAAHGAPSVIAKYQMAACILPLRSSVAAPRTREWKTILSLRDGSKVAISAAEIAGGRVTVSDTSSGREYVAADAGDYIYPEDLRLDVENERLYVKAHGLWAGIREQTWLFEYDLRQHRRTARVRVKNGSLPLNCQVPPIPQPRKF
jgi:hypothetical protein